MENLLLEEMEADKKTRKMIDVIENEWGIKLLQYQKKYMYEIGRMKMPERKAIFPRGVGFNYSLAMCLLLSSMYEVESAK